MQRIANKRSEDDRVEDAALVFMEKSAVSLYVHNQSDR